MDNKFQNLDEAINAAEQKARDERAKHDHLLWVAVERVSQKEFSLVPSDSPRASTLLAKNTVHIAYV